MDNMFSFIGGYANFENFNKDQNQILTNFPTWGKVGFDNDERVAAEDVAKRVEDVCKPFTRRLFEDGPAGFCSWDYRERSRNPQGQRVPDV